MKTVAAFAAAAVLGAAALVVSAPAPANAQVVHFSFGTSYGGGGFGHHWGPRPVYVAPVQYGWGHGHGWGHQRQVWHHRHGGWHGGGPVYYARPRSFYAGPGWAPSRHHFGPVCRTVIVQRWSNRWGGWVQRPVRVCR